MRRLLGIAGSGRVITWVSSGSFVLIKLTHVLQTASIRADDHATIGAILFAMLTPAFFWRQANVVNREYSLIRLALFASDMTPGRSPVILGGAGLGTGAGLYYHFGRSLSGDSLSPRSGPNEPL
jgi:hypothetical protein